MQEKESFASLQKLVTEKCLHLDPYLHIPRIINKLYTRSSSIGAPLTGEEPYRKCNIAKVPGPENSWVFQE